MSNNNEDEFRIRLEDPLWDKKIGESVTREFGHRKKRLTKGRFAIAILVLILGTLWENKIQTELTLEETGYELLSHISGTDFIILDEE